MQVDPYILTAFAVVLVGGSSAFTWLVARGLRNVRDDDVVRPRGTWWQHANERSEDFGEQTLGGKQEE